MEKKNSKKVDEKKEKDTKTGPDDDDLTRQAMEELTKGARRAKERVQTMGALGWKDSPIPSANKRYLKNTILNAMQSNHHTNKTSSKTSKHSESSSSKSSDRANRTSNRSSVKHEERRSHGDNQDTFKRSRDCSDDVYGKYKKPR